jgi:hypothetical protein
MKEMEEQDLDELLKGHLAGQLSPHAGASVERFEQELRRLHRRGLRLWVGLTAVGSLAASIVVMLVMVYGGNPRKPPIIAMPAADGPNAPAALVAVERSLDWRALEEGTVLLENNIPARRVRRQVVEQVRWYDPQEQKYIKTTTPKEDVIFIGLTKY